MAGEAGTVRHGAPRGSTAQSGQSLVEVALGLPYMALLLLICINAGMASQAHLALTQAVQQEAQLWVQHPENTFAAYSADMKAYLSAHGFANAGSATVSVSQSFGSVGELVVTANVSYPYALLMPIASALNAGSFHNGTIALGTSASTIASTSTLAAGTGLSVSCAGGSCTPYSGHTLTWSPPTLPDGTALPSTWYYTIYSFGTRIAQRTMASSSCTVTSCTFTDTGAGTPPTTATYYDYAVELVQPNGLASPLVEVSCSTLNCSA